MDKVEVHIDCYSEVKNIGEDGISYCPMCECICEGETKRVPESECEEFV